MAYRLLRLSNCAHAQPTCRFYLKAIVADSIPEPRTVTRSGKQPIQRQTARQETSRIESRVGRLRREIPLFSHRRSKMLIVQITVVHYAAFGLQFLHTSPMGPL
jgi:hypothetical protein